MSFILDALKKSESDRQRQSGPALYEVKVAAPRSQLPYWAIGLIALLCVNLVIVAWALLRRPSHEADAQTAAATAQPPVPSPIPAPAAAPASYAPPVASAAAPTQPRAPATGGAQAPSQGNAQPPPTFIAGAQEPSAQGAREGSSSGYADLPPEEDATAGAGSSGGTPARSGTGPMGSRAPQGPSGEPAGNPDDYAPASEPGKAPGLGFHVTRGTAEGVPLYSQVASGAGIPELRLDMHAYDNNPQKRFVLINMKKEREGDMLPDGTTRVDTITPDGVVLDHEGTKFLLPRP